MDDIHIDLRKEVNFNNLNTDYKAEVVALNLVKIYKEIDQILLKRLGSSNRSFRKDVHSIAGKVYESDETTLSIETFRESIYDYLPEGIFHTPTLGKAYDEIDEVVSQIKKQKKIEDNARKFFEPFELETYFTELGALHLENNYDILEQSNLLVETVSELWPLLSELDSQTARVFIYLLPFFHSVRGKKGWFEKCLIAFLKVPVNISFIPNIIRDTDMLLETIKDDDPQLDISMLLSGDHIDGQRNWCINIGPIPYQVLDKYIPKSALRKLLNRLYDFCIPLNIEVREEFITEKDHESFRLSDDGNTSILEYSTFL